MSSLTRQPGAVRPHRRARAGRLASGDVIRAAATTLFLQKGYQGTSMDDVAAAAGVSKQTIYTHFAGKEELFKDLVLANASRVGEFTATMGTIIGEAATLEDGLGALARRYLQFVIRPEVLRLRRLVIGEAARFPDLARDYYEAVPNRVYEALAGLFGELMSRGDLRPDDPLLAAHHFAWLTLGLPLDRAMFDVDATAGANDLDIAAKAAARAFLAAYRPGPADLASG